MSNCCGAICVRMTIKETIMAQVIKGVFNSKPRYEFMNSFWNRLLISNSFIGLDQPTFLPQNILVSGPLVEAPDNLLQKLETEHVDLWKWLEECTA